MRELTIAIAMVLWLLLLIVVAAATLAGLEGPITPI
jgi:hypothetical protein